MPVTRYNERLEAAFRAVEHTFDLRQRLILGEEACRRLWVELDEAIDAAGPTAMTEDTTGVVWVEDLNAARPPAV